jgi:hypothetical protein
VWSEGEWLEELLVKLAEIGMVMTVSASAKDYDLT